MVKTTPCKLIGLEVLMLIVVQDAGGSSAINDDSVECQNRHGVTYGMSLSLA